MLLRRCNRAGRSSYEVREAAKEDDYARYLPRTALSAGSSEPKPEAESHIFLALVRLAVEEPPNEQYGNHLCAFRQCLSREPHKAECVVLAVGGSKVCSCEHRIRVNLPRAKMCLSFGLLLDRAVRPRTGQAGRRRSFTDMDREAAALVGEEPDPEPGSKPEKQSPAQRLNTRLDSTSREAEVKCSPEGE